LVNAVRETLRPKNLFATIHANDIAYGNWRVQQFRSIEATLLTPKSTASQGAASVARAEAYAAAVIPWLDTPMEDETGFEAD
jgi:hypothetical protein